MRGPNNEASSSTLSTIQRMGWDKRLLVQASPGVGAYDLLLTCPARHSITITSIVICNGGVATSYRITHAQPGAVAAVLGEALYWDQAIPAAGVGVENTHVRTPNHDTSGWTLITGEMLWAGSASGDVTFSVYGYVESEL